MDTQQGENKGEKLVNKVAGFALLALAVFFIINSIGMTVFDKYSPGPGLFPLLLGIILALLSTSLVLDGFSTKKADKAHSFNNKRGMISAALLIVGLCVYAFLIPIVGYVISTFLLVVYVMKAVVNNPWKTALLTALTVSIMLFLIFSVALRVNLPKSPFGVF
ncbi:MAG: tripartite tricarboxylate transporter TctB family protein [Clostridiales bacterium]|jgi:uncharacterized membrane protein YidH (DUF202 family)|nr:tripartite tricarboxylate transporter TctB family protein [Clostridiales bacterium]